jgi:hypothetical protein
MRRETGRIDFGHAISQIKVDEAKQRAREQDAAVHQADKPRLPNNKLSPTPTL